MPPSQRMTETVVFHLREGVSLGNLTSSNPSQAVTAFVQLTNSIKDQQGFICQFWGHEVEHPDLFVWCIDWESFEDHTVFINSEEHHSFLAGLSQVFDLQVAAPVTLYTRVPDYEASIAAFRSPVTEVAFFTMPARPDEETKAAMEKNTFNSTVRNVQTIGKASGAAVGWVFGGVPHAVVSGSEPISLSGVFGYASIDVHMRWRETLEAIEAGKMDEGMVPAMPATMVPGIDPNTGYFHVKFREGT